MVRRALRPAALAAALALAALVPTACGLFTGSLFPWYLSGMEASRDLSDWIEGYISAADLESGEWWADMAVVRDGGGNDFVLITIDGMTASNGLIALDGDLSPLDPTPLMLSSMGRARMVDAAGRFVVGTDIYDIPALTWSGNTGGTPDQLGVTDGTSNYLLSTITTTWSELKYDQYDSVWTYSAPGSGSAQVSAAVLYDWELLDAAYDPVPFPTEPFVLLLVHRGASPYLRVVFTALPPSCLPLDGCAGAAIPVSDFDRVQYTRKGIVVRDYEDRIRRFDPASGAEKPSLSLGTNHDIVDAYDLEGDTFYIFDKTALRIYKGSTGW